MAFSCCVAIVTELEIREGELRYDAPASTTRSMPRYAEAAAAAQMRSLAFYGARRRLSPASTVDASAFR